MLNLAEITIYYVNNTFQPELKKSIYNSFSLLESFGRKFYEDQLIDLVQREDITSDSKRDTFYHLVQKEIKNIIKEHFIFLSQETNVTLEEMNEVANFLYIIQNLEDYTMVSYRLNAEDTPRNIIVDLIDYLTLLDKPRIMEIISHVEEHFIESLKAFIIDKEDSDDETIDMKHMKHIRHFLNFIEHSKCMGNTFFTEGFSSLTLEEFTRLIRSNIPAYIDKLILVDRAQAALDCLSILIVCKDSYELPILKFKQHTGLFTHDLENVTKLEASMLSMLNDFNMFLEVKKQEELVNAG